MLKDYLNRAEDLGPRPHPTRTLLTVRQLAERVPALTEGGIRWDLFNRKVNGLAKSGAVIQRGRKVLIDPDRYMDWLAHGQQGGLPLQEDRR